MLERKLNQYVFMSIVIACLQFVLIICISFVSIEGTMIQKTLAYIIAFLFWISIIFEIVLVRLSDKERRKSGKRFYIRRKINQSPIGMFSFFKNKEAIVVDIIFIISIVSIVIIICMHAKASWIIISVVSIFILSFNLHCILNGRNYRYLKELKNKKE